MCVKLRSYTRKNGTQINFLCGYVVMFGDFSAVIRND